MRHSVRHIGHFIWLVRVEYLRHPQLVADLRGSQHWSTSNDNNITCYYCSALPHHSWFQNVHFQIDNFNGNAMFHCLRCCCFHPSSSSSFNSLRSFSRRYRKSKRKFIFNLIWASLVVFDSPSISISQWYAATLFSRGSSPMPSSSCDVAMPHDRAYAHPFGELKN